MTTRKLASSWPPDVRAACGGICGLGSTFSRSSTRGGQVLVRTPKGVRFGDSGAFPIVARCCLRGDLTGVALLSVALARDCASRRACSFKVAALRRGVGASSAGILQYSWPSFGDWFTETSCSECLGEREVLFGAPDGDLSAKDGDGIAWPAELRGSDFVLAGDEFLTPKTSSSTFSFSDVLEMCAAVGRSPAMLCRASCSLTSSDFALGVASSSWAAKSRCEMLLRGDLRGDEVVLCDFRGDELVPGLRGDELARGLRGEELMRGLSGEELILAGEDRELTISVMSMALEPSSSCAVSCVGEAAIVCSTRSGAGLLTRPRALSSCSIEDSSSSSLPERSCAILDDVGVSIDASYTRVICIDIVGSTAGLMLDRSRSMALSSDASTRVVTDILDVPV